MTKLLVTLTSGALFFIASIVFFGLVMSLPVMLL